MIFDPDIVKGFKDYLPPQSLLRERIIAVAKEKFLLFGFQPVETPIIEYDELMRSDSLEAEEDEAVRDRYRLKDRGGRNLGLRYEFTFQLARLFKMNPNLKLPFKRFQIGPVFRDEPTRTGRTRQFVQCDVDVLGDSSVNAEVECVAVMSEVLRDLGIKDFMVQVNNRKLFTSLLDSVQVTNKVAVMRELDKIDKIGEDAVKTNLKAFAETNQVIALFKLLQKPLQFFVDNLFEGAQELSDLMSLCKSYGVPCEFSPGLMRGLEYYTGNVFEVVKNKVSLLGGGRYDNLVGKFVNRVIPAVGVSFSVESLMGLCAEELSGLKLEGVTSVVVVSLDQDKHSVSLVKKLRKSKVNSEVFFTKPGKALEYANSLQIPFVVFVGADEVKSKKFKLKDLASGKEQLLTEKQLISKLKK